MLVHQILKSKPTEGVVSVASTATVAEASRLLSDKGIGTVLVSDDGETAMGILSERDIVRNLGRSGSGCLEHPVSRYMTKKLVTCTRQTTAQEIMKQMTDGRFRHVPVVEEDKLIGLVSLGDVVKAQLAELEMEKEALEGMIMGH
ncbi:MAG: CBS domain-containing protein [Paracoccaceae bacterium]